MCLMEHTGAIGQDALPVIQIQLYSIYFLIILATVIFFFLYGGDLVYRGRRRFYLPAFVFYILLYVVSAVTLFPHCWSADTVHQTLSIARTFFTTSSLSATLALFS